MMVGFLRHAHMLRPSFAHTASPIPPSFHFLAGGRHPFSSGSEESNPPFTVTYLVNRCGLSHKDALSASKLIRFETPDRPDSVLAFFDNHGFSKSQTSKMVKTRPQLLLVSDPDKIILPKLQFFLSRGASWSDVTKIVVYCPQILHRSLDNTIIPAFNFLRDFLESDKTAMAVARRYSRILLSLDTYVDPNINALRDFGVPKSDTAVLLRNQPRAFMMRLDLFREIIEKVKRMGFDPSQRKFVVAIQAMRAVGKSTWERKINLYKRWGWSEEEVVSAFIKSPWCMVYSEDKISAAMDFFVNRMGLEPSLIVRMPVLISLSLEKRLIPRYSVVQVLLSKGLIRKDISPLSLFVSKEKMFLHRFVSFYREEAPLLMKLYQEKINLAEARCLQQSSFICSFGNSV